MDYGTDDRGVCAQLQLDNVRQKCDTGGLCNPVQTKGWTATLDETGCFAAYHAAITGTLCAKHPRTLDEYAKVLSEAGAGSRQASKEKLPGTGPGTLRPPAVPHSDATVTGHACRENNAPNQIKHVRGRWEKRNRTLY